MPFLNPDLLLLGQPSEDLPKVLAQLPVQRSTASLRYKDHVIFALPLRVA
jgi:hypothetical protein